MSYPSYTTTIQQLGSFASIVGLPTTVFFNAAGKVVYVHTGQYDALGTLEADLASYGLGR